MLLIDVNTAKMTKKHFLIVCLILLGTFFSACWGLSSSDGRSAADSTPDSQCLVQYARGFTLTYHKAYRQLSVFSPWQQAGDVRYDYYLVDRRQPIPDALAGKTVIKTPVERIVCLSTTHLAFVDALGQADGIVGVSGKDYVYNPLLRQRIAQGDLPDVGFTGQLNYELIYSLKPDIVMAYAVGQEGAEFLHKLNESGIPVVMNAEYLENHPLGKAEWLKFVGAFYDKETEAAAIFDTIVARYHQLKVLTDSIEQRPTVISALPYQGNWWVAGGRSYAANLIADAGGQYLWANDSSHESSPLTIEAVYRQARDADIWINLDMAKSKGDILTVDARLADFEAFKNNELYNNDARQNALGYNDYMESGTLHPHLILKDLIKIFHPALLAKHQLYYYRKLSN